MVKQQVGSIIEKALQKCAADGLLPAGRYQAQLEAPRQAAHGDFACNAAMVLQKIAKTNPRHLAQAIVERIDDPDHVIERVEIAGPGFLNIQLAKSVWQRALGEVWEERERFGRSDTGKGLRTMVEFVSANPTGPMHVGHGRGAVIGDVVANLLEWAGYSVYREFYINDAGGQVWRLANARLARPTQPRARLPPRAPGPRDFHGQYVLR